MILTPIHHERGRYEVQSSNTLRCFKCNREFKKNLSGRCSKCDVEAYPAMYLVDVLSFCGRGQCSCPHFRIKIQPLFSVKNFDVKPCTHLIAAFYSFGREQAIKLADKPQTI